MSNLPTPQSKWEAGIESWHPAPEAVLLQSSRLGCSPDLNLGLASFAKHTLTAQPALTSPGYICLSLKGVVLAILEGSLHQGPALLLLSLPRPHGWATGVRRSQLWELVGPGQCQYG